MIGLFVLGLLTLIFASLADGEIEPNIRRVSRGRFEYILLGHNHYGKYYCKANGLYYGLVINGEWHELGRFFSKAKCLEWLERMVIKYE